VSLEWDTVALPRVIRGRALPSFGGLQTSVALIRLAPAFNSFGLKNHGIIRKKVRRKNLGRSHWGGTSSLLSSVAVKASGSS
jgi:hypothetical protein